MTHDLARPLDPATAAAWLRDLLEQLREGADAVLTEVLADRDVRGLRVVGHRVPHQDAAGGTYYVRSSLEGPVGTLSRRGSQRDGAVAVWGFTVTWLGHGADTTTPRRGEGPTLAAADRALCLALRELGWSPVEVPTEEQAAAPPERVEVSVGTPVRVERQADGTTVATRRNDPLQVDWTQGEPMERVEGNEIPMVLEREAD